MAKQVS